jgi:nitrate/TMAO reductase-like tetraheme cytochrome c subunit
MEYTKSSCKGCEERHPGCHTTCEVYKAFREKLDKEKESRIQAQKVNDIMDDYTARRVDKTKKALRRIKAQKRNGNR